MKKIVTALLLTVLICGSLGEILPDKYSKLLSARERLLKRKPSPRFDGGQLADWSEYPYVVAVTNGTVFRGGGTIIAENFVLTYFATVVPDYYATDLKVLHGDIEKNVSEVFIFPDIEPASIALIKLADKFDLNGPNISSIALRNDSVPVGTNCTVVGVGGTIDDIMTAPEEYLHYITVSIMNLEDCDTYWYTDLPEGNLCTALNERVDICLPSFGDSLVCDGILTGVSSLLDMCIDSEDRSIYGDVAYYKDWIEQQMNNNSHSEVI